MSKERLEEFKDYIDFLDDSIDMQDNGRFVDTLHSLYEDGWFDWVVRYAKEQTKRVQELEREFEFCDSTMHMIDMTINNPSTSDDDKFEKVNTIIKKYYAVIVYIAILKDSMV